MKRLIFLRHAKTEDWYEGVDDHGRALVPRGHEDAARVARALSKAGWTADHLIVSTARRTRETARAISAAMPGASVRFSEALYLSSPETIEEVLQAAPLEGCVMVIAHNPGLHEIACTVARIGGSSDETASHHLFEKFPTSCAALFEAQEETAFHTAGFRLQGVIRAKDLRED